jgi:hypothetical protein
MVLSRATDEMIQLNLQLQHVHMDSAKSPTAKVEK